jgi:N-acetylmuramoyl-L-alanine amidase
LLLTHRYAGSAQFIGLLLYTVKKWVYPVALGVSFLALGAGLAAFASYPNDAQPVSTVTLAAPQAVPVVALTATVAAPPSEALATPETLQTLVSVRVAHPHPVGPNIECMAKVVYHEAANQALAGQLAVAQVILNRTAGGPIFPNTVCGVVNQQGQFFQTRLFKVPQNDSARWRTALAVAMVAEEKHLAQVAPGALFYHAASMRPTWSHRHQKVAQIGDQIFYR